MALQLPFYGAFPRQQMPILVSGKLRLQAADETYARAPGLAPSKRQRDAKIGLLTTSLSLLPPTLDEWNSPSLDRKRLSAELRMRLLLLRA